MGYTDPDQEKIRFSGVVRSVQVRSTVWRYRLDNRTHSEIGYNIFLRGHVQHEDDDNSGKKDAVDLSVAISETQMQKLRAHIGDRIQGTAWTKMYPKREYADYYRAGALKKVKGGPIILPDGPPWRTEVPDLETYAWRGARMLDPRCYKGKCFQCKWAAMSNVTIEYNWGVSQRLRFESFCYGPKSCELYKMGKARAVPYKDMGSVYDEGWLDEICTQNRGPDD